MKTLPANRDGEAKHAKLQTAGFGRASGAAAVPKARTGRPSEPVAPARSDEIQQMKIALLSARNDQVRDLRAHLTRLTGLQSTLSETERAKQTAEQENRRLDSKNAHLQAELTTAEQAVAELSENRLANERQISKLTARVHDLQAELRSAEQAVAELSENRLANEREISKLTARLQDTQKQLESALGALAEERELRKQQVSRSDAQLAQFRARLAERDRDLSRELAHGNELAQDLAVARRNFERAERALRLMMQLEEIAARTAPVSPASERPASQKQTAGTLRRIRRVAKGEISFLTLQRLRRAVKKSGAFDAVWYRHQRPDLTTEQDPLDHFIFHGIDEGASPNPLIDVDWISRSAGESRKAALRSYLLHGRHAELSPTALFDVRYYRAIAGLGATADALSHYLRHGRAAGLSPHPLFDPAFYVSQLPKHAGSTVDPFLHYVLCPLELDPHPLFSTEYYLGQHPELPTIGISPLVHYLEYGLRERTSPHRDFSGPAYLDRYSDVAAAGLNPLLHYVAFGKAEGRQIDPVS